MKGVIKIKSLKLNIPEFRQRSERETEEMLHKYRVIARKKQIEMIKDELEIPFMPLSIPQYTHPKRQIQVLKVLLGYLKLFLP